VVAKEPNVPEDNDEVLIAIALFDVVTPFSFSSVPSTEPFTGDMDAGKFVLFFSLMTRVIT
jgi:hypothetical protein